MKKYFVIVFILIPSVISGQWFWQYPKPQGNTLRDIFIFDSSKAIAVGDLGTVIKTYNGGESWDVQHHAGGTNIDLYSVHFTDTLNGWATGGIWFVNKNVLLKTNDGGQNWTEVATETDLPLNAVYFVDADTGIVVGEDGIVLRTTDGGSSWDTRKMDVYIGYYLDIFRLLAITFTDKQTGWIVGSGYYGNQIFKTTNCGRTWEWNPNIIIPRYYGSINDISFVNKNNGFITGDMGCFAKTTDEGITWQYQNLYERYQKEKYQYFYSVFFADTLKGWIVGSGFILNTTDGGDNWNEIWTEQQFGSVFYKVRLTNNDLNSEQTGWSVGGDGMIYKTSNTGENWAAQRDEKYVFSSVYFIDENTGWAVGDSGVVMHSENGGINWYRQNKNDSLILYSVYALDEQNVFVVGAILKGSWPAYSSDGIILHSTTGGQDWTRQIFDTLVGFRSVTFITDSIGLITDRSGTLLKTTNKGNTWEIFASGLGTVLDKIQFIDNNTGWISFYMGNKILKTVDGGQNWNAKFIDSSLSMYSFHFVDADKGWAVGEENWGAKIYKTTNGGDDWTLSGNPPITNYSSVYFINENIGWASGGKIISGWRTSTIIKTTDGGNNWIEQECPSIYSPTDIYFINENTGWIVGDGIFKTTNGGVVSVKNEWENGRDVPEVFTLYQNYPNPFNPTTVIKYYLKEPGFVSIKVYNILGREVTTLVNEYQKVGNYLINFNARGLSSGVYFSRLTSGNSNITKKMILLK
ncbi:MAG: hypothetical protein A2315_01245 [Ignavibacteria bacterium RIFOXYB2_FULL_35_12]|nr:MAG: hypothetical protein A2058_10195 [Ignavibacteria bacterium GWA2_36_19]OGU56011.1 MAG: hypothetical protein A2X60_14975 [Ignavibacteria bacterium GWF2_35_20]OGU84011.1 MAG: hypothetical protein A3K31_14300 [Ignavibacteria bacterium RIFOXYA12_FULL_35_25]OGU92652.1 MAG: hypothetical protein A2492_11880 [Ignavibacteria bacterium RIFOXYC12_FULL_35_11]OGU95229.1 MAG: hypothetical protein A2347_03700 [Ignavibacteria bacterium RIFOXYB12_FULL_35_14]OGU99411.1 MAG: hypothetical protein A2455_028